MQFWNGDSKIKLSYILRVQATLYENYKGGHMSRTRWNYRYFIRSVVVIMCVVFCVGCQKKSQETDLKTVSVREEEPESTPEDSREDTTEDVGKVK